MQENSLQMDELWTTKGNGFYLSFVQGYCVNPSILPATPPEVSPSHPVVRRAQLKVDKVDKERTRIPIRLDQSETMRIILGSEF